MPKIAELEALRGLAALTVVVSHYMGSFAPARLGGQGFTGGLFGTPVYAVANGHAAVCVFFVLSGFVLPLAYFEAGASKIIVRGAAKRWFRLVFLVLLSTLASYACFALGLYHYREAGALTHSPWLLSFGSNDATGNFDYSLFGALAEGTFLSFLHNQSSYNVALWTMYHEFFGSYLSFALALCLFKSRLPAILWFLALSVAIIAYTDPRLISFVVGTGLAFFYTRYGRVAPWPIAAICLVIGVYLYGYSGSGAAYAWLAFSVSEPWHYDWIAVHTFSGALLIIGLYGTPFGRALAASLCRFLGRISFPLYVIHVPLLCSLAAYLYLAWRPSLNHATVAAVTLAFIPSLLAISYVLALVDEGWLRIVNRYAKRLVSDAPYKFE